MTLSDPLGATAITQGILANIATEILEHHAKSLDGTLAGRMLKWAGLIGPNFYDRLRETIIQALELYFETHPAYRLTGVIAYFSDPVTAKQIGDFILQRRPLDSQQLQHALDQHINEDRIAYVLIQQRGLDPQRIVPDFLECYRQTLNKQLSTPAMALLLELFDQSEAVIREMRASEDRIKRLVEQVIQGLQSGNTRLERISADIQVIIEKLGLNRPEASIVEEMNIALTASYRSSIFEPGGWCSGYDFVPQPKHCFLAQAFTPDRADLRRALTDALAQLDMRPITADDIFWPGFLICKISGLVQSTPFGIYQLTKSQNRNVHLELGIAMGLRRPFILVKDRDAELCPLIQGLEYYPIESYLELSSELGAKVRPFLTEIGKYAPPYLGRPGESRTAVVAHGNVESIDFCIEVARAVSKFNLTSVILGDPNGKIAEYLAREKLPHSVIGTEGTWLLDSVMTAIQKARFGVFRIEKECSADAFSALGISMGLNRPGIMVAKQNRDMPSDLAGVVKLEFDCYTNLGTSLLRRYGDFITRHSG